MVGWVGGLANRRNGRRGWLLWWRFRGGCASGDGDGAGGGGDGGHVGGGASGMAQWTIPNVYVFACNVRCMSCAWPYHHVLYILRIYTLILTYTQTHRDGRAVRLRRTSTPPMLVRTGRTASYADGEDTLDATCESMKLVERTR